MSEIHTIARRVVRRRTVRSSTLARMPHALLAQTDGAESEARAAELREQGFRISLARTGFEAIVKASCHVPDLILLGPLSDMDPEETSRLLATCPVTEHIPVVRLVPGRRVSSRRLGLLRRAVS